MVQQHEQDHWWSSYGPFLPADEQATRPHAGRVIAHYRKLAGWSAARLGAELGLKERQVYNMQNNPDVPEPLSRRELLVQALHIPPALLGVVALAHVSPVSQQASTLPPDTTEAYEHMLKLAWNSYYGGSAELAAAAVAHWLKHLEALISQSYGVTQDRLRAILCRFYQLSGVAARDRLDWDTSLTHASQALNLAFELGNAELVTSSLFRRARTHVEMRNIEPAIADLERALPYAERSRTPQRCYTLLCLAEAYSLASPCEAERRKTSIRLLDTVARTVRSQGVLEGDGSNTKVDAPGMLIIRGDVFRRFGDLEEADNALQIAHDHLPRHFVRWQGNLLVSEAQLAFAEQNIEGACDLSIDALDILNSTRSSSTRAKIERLHARMRRVAPAVLAVKELGERIDENS